MSNTFKTVALLGLLTGLIVLIGDAVGGRQGMVIAFLLAALMNFGAYWFSDRIVLAMYRAKALPEADAPKLYRMMRELAQQARLPMPRLSLIPTATPNAFATGRSPERATVTVTEGLLRILDEEELEGVLAHELAHVKNRDMLTMTIAATLAGVVVMLARMALWFPVAGERDQEGRGSGVLGVIVLAILAPLAATLIQLAISRSREFQADETGARITRKPWALANALEKLEWASKRLPLEANPATAHLFIVNPLRGRGLFSLFMTHPPIQARVSRLRAMKG
ncbi:MAG: zinc metalloprotease HtpX [candidate division NC10 bacterium]|nr:zinc metalloprotease HtpX [candidate division NC10 bacterium]